MPASGLTLYQLHTAATIGAVLQELQLQKSTLSLYACNPWPDTADTTSNPAPFGMASVVELDVPAQTLGLAMSAPLLPLPAQAWAVTHMAGGVRVQWLVQGDWQTTDGQQWLLHMAWPEQLLQLQRRRHQRLSVPLGHNYSASFMFGRRRGVLDMDDVSMGGVALRGTRQETAMLFMGRDLPQVSLHMANGTVLSVHLKVRSRRSYRSFLLGAQVLVGCSVETMADKDRLQLENLLESGM